MTTPEQTMREMIHHVFADDPEKEKATMDYLMEPVPVPSFAMGGDRQCGKTQASAAWAAKARNAGERVVTLTLRESVSKGDSVYVNGATYTVMSVTSDGILTMFKSPVHSRRHARAVARSRRNNAAQKRKKKGSPQ